ncbi:TrmH family RNA methyltransferase [Labilibacter sediminis]|nr:TrmH family RNA methyltransferase [Labilibacter sediminis]
MDNSNTKSSPLFSDVSYSLKTEGPIIVAYQFKSPENMGHIIRLASNFGCSKVIFIGDKALVRERKIKKVGGAAAGQIDWFFCDEEHWKSLIPEDYSIVAIETATDSKNICENRLPSKMVMLLGNEIYGLPNDLVQQCHETFHIPMVGGVKSMNVSHACSVALYEWVRQNYTIG